MLELFVLGAHLLPPPEPGWSAKKRLLRQRLVEVVEGSNALYDRDEPLPRLTLARLPGKHGSFNHDWNVLKLDLESVHDREKFWHVYRETIPHEWAHHMNTTLHGEKGHGAQFASLLDAISAAADGTETEARPH